MKKNSAISREATLPTSKTESCTQKPAKCPFCQSTHTELYSLFGSTLSTSQYYCKNCRTVFERIKWE